MTKMAQNNNIMMLGAVALGAYALSRIGSTDKVEARQNSITDRVEIRTTEKTDRVEIRQTEKTARVEARQETIQEVSEDIKDTITDISDNRVDNIENRGDDKTERALNRQDAFLALLGKNRNQSINTSLNVQPYLYAPPSLEKSRQDAENAKATTSKTSLLSKITQASKDRTQARKDAIAKAKTSLSSRMKSFNKN